MQFLKINGQKFLADSYTNINDKIINCLRTNLLLDKTSPLSHVWQRLQGCFDESFAKITDSNPVVKTKTNFDELLISKTHPSRSKSESYYINSEWMLRTHMTANERQAMKAGKKRFLIAGNVFRRDEIDYTHFPCFHQMEGVCIFDRDEIYRLKSKSINLNNHICTIFKNQLEDLFDFDDYKAVFYDLFITLNNILQNIFGSSCEVRWNQTNFPFTNPSMEAEIYHKGQWIEILGCGILKNQIITKNIQTNPPNIGWAFGIGLERIAMILHEIPDIRLFWTKDPRFSKQFSNWSPVQSPIVFREYSKYPPIKRDISFFIPSIYSSNNFYEVVRDNAPTELIEEVKLIDKYHTKNAVSHCYRITYRSMCSNLTDYYVNEIQEKIRSACVLKLGVILK